MRYDFVANMVQHYENYTPENFDVWKILFDRQMPQLEELATKEYLQGLKKIEFTASKIPDIKQTNKLLASQTGWELIVVPGIIKEPDFFNLLSQKKFPATTWLRKQEEIDYLPEPDMFHDVFGHVPVLTNYHFTEFFQTIGKLGVKHLQNENIVAMLGRLYWFTVEFGLIKTNNELKIYGAGIISSYGETKFCVSDKPTHVPYEAERIMNTSYENDHIQDTYFVIDSFEQLYHSINKIEEVVAKHL